MKIEITDRETALILLCLGRVADSVGKTNIEAGIELLRLGERIQSDTKIVPLNLNVSIPPSRSFQRMSGPDWRQVL